MVVFDLSKPYNRTCLNTLLPLSSFQIGKIGYYQLYLTDITHMTIITFFSLSVKSESRVSRIELSSSEFASNMMSDPDE